MGQTLGQLPTVSPVSLLMLKRVRHASGGSSEMKLDPAQFVALAPAALAEALQKGTRPSHTHALPPSHTHTRTHNPHVAPPACGHTGFLLKRGKVRTAWKKRYFARYGNLLYYFASTTAKSVIGCVLLEGSQTKKSDDRAGHAACFEVTVLQGSAHNRPFLSNQLTPRFPPCCCRSTRPVAVSFR